MDRVNWVVDRHILKHSENKNKIIEALEQHSTYVVRDYEYFKTISIPDEFLDGPTIVYGTQQFSESVAQTNGIAPGSYYIPERFFVSQYTSMIKNPAWFLNGDYVCMPYVILKQRWSEIFKMFGSPEALFVRPDNGKKVFSGLTINFHEAPQSFSALEQLTSVTDNTMVCVSRSKKILQEFRYIIVEGKVVAHSRYMKNDEIDPSPEDHHACRLLAQLVAEHDYQIDLAYVCDVALVDGEEFEAYVVEFNAIGTSGWYYADPNEIVRALNAAAIREYRGEITV